MSETRDFPTAVIASLSSGIMFCEHFSDMHEAAEFLMGHPIFTHHFASKDLWREMQRTISEQCPGLPMTDDGIDKNNALTKLAEIEAEVGKTVRLRKGGGLTAMLPTDGIPDRLKGNVTIISK